MSPDDPDAFMLPDLPTQFIEIDKQENLSEANKCQARGRKFFPGHERTHPLYKPVASRLQPLRAR